MFDHNRGICFTCFPLAAEAFFLVRKNQRTLLVFRLTRMVQDGIFFAPKLYAVLRAGEKMTSSKASATRFDTESLSTYIKLINLKF